MGEGFKAWWSGRTARERRLIGVMLALAALVLGWLLVLRPLADARADARERHDKAVIVLAEARVQAAEIESLQKAPRPAPDLPVTDLVARSAAAAGFAVARLERTNEGGAKVVIDAARPQAFFAWIAGLEREGLIVVSLNARPNADRTLAVESTLRPRG